MLKNNHVPSYLMPLDQNENTGGAGGAAAAPTCAGLWIPGTVMLKTLGKNEAWLQEQVVANPSILGLGDVSVVRKERKQPSGRLDFLLRNDDDSRRFEVEIQLGATNPDHIIRTIEYWDVERRRYPQYSHCGVLVAEEITGRFFNVISLLNNSGQMPLMALKLTAIKSPCDNNGVGLLFTKILGEFAAAPDESESDMQPATREDWVQRSGEQQVAFAEEIFHAIAGDKWSPNPTMRYFGMRNKDTDQVNAKFAVAPAKHEHVWVRFRMPRSEEWDIELGKGNVVGFVDYKPEPGWSCYRFKSTRANFEKQKPILRQLFQDAVSDGNNEGNSSD